MKRIFVICLVLALLVACQPTPEKDAVRQKNQDAMLELAKAEGEEVVINQSAVEEGNELPRLDYYAMYDIPKHLNKEFSGLPQSIATAEFVTPRIPRCVILRSRKAATKDLFYIMNCASA